MSYLLIQFARLIANTSVILRKLFQFILFYHFLNRNWDQFPPHNNLYFLQHIDILPTGGTWIFSPECDVSRGFQWSSSYICCQVSEDENVNKLMKFSTQKARWLHILIPERRGGILSISFLPMLLDIDLYWERSSVGDCVDKNSINLIVSWPWTLLETP